MTYPIFIYWTSNICRNNDLTINAASTILITDVVLWKKFSTFSSCRGFRTSPWIPVTFKNYQNNDQNKNFFEQLPECPAHLVMINWTVCGTRPAMLGIYVWSAPMTVILLQRIASMYVYNTFLQIKTHILSK